ncbi:MAG: tetratricopeptide repeat protein [Phycisphaeraceae bacterium]
MPPHADAGPLPFTLAPPDADVWFERGVIHEQQQAYTQARDAYTEALALDPAFCEAAFNLGNVCRGLGDSSRAAACFRLASRLDPYWAQTSYNLADVLIEQGALSAACAALRQAIAVAPAYADAHYNLAWCCQQLGCRSEAQRHWRTYLKLAPEGPWARRAWQQLACG